MVSVLQNTETRVCNPQGNCDCECKGFFFLHGVK